MSTLLDPDVRRSASYRHMAGHLTPPFAGGAGDTPVGVDAAGVATVDWVSREPLLVVAPLGPLDTSELEVDASVNGNDLPGVEFAPYTEAGAFLPLYLPSVDPDTRLAQPLTLKLSIPGHNDNEIATLVEVRLIEGVLGRLLYVLGGEKERLRREGREIAAMRVLTRARDHALDSIGADLGVPRFSDQLEYNQSSNQIVTTTRHEPDDEYRRRLAVYRSLWMPSPKRVDRLLNGPGAAADPNAGPLHGIDPQFVARFTVTEGYNPFAVAVQLVGTGGSQRRDRFVDYVRDTYLVWPRNTAQSNERHARRFVASEVKQRQDALRRVLRTGFDFVGDAADEPGFAPSLADVLGRVAECCAALGVPGKWQISKAQKSGDAHPSRYELGLGADLAVPVPGELDLLKANVEAANRPPDPDKDVEALLQAMSPNAKSSADDPEGRWFLEACGLRTVHRIDANTLYVSHLPIFGLLISGAETADVGGWAEIVPGNFVYPNQPSFLAYDRHAGTGRFYAVADDGTATPVGPALGGWRTSWAIILAGKFGGPLNGRGFDDLLFYDRESGQAEFYAFDASKNALTLLGTTRTDWRKTWSQIVPGSFGGDGTHTDLLFYDPDVGEVELYSTPATSFTQIGATLAGWRKTWSLAVPLLASDLATQEVVFYDRENGVGEIYAVASGGRLNVVAEHGTWRKSWTHIVPGFFWSHAYGDLFFYDRDSGDAEFYTVADDGKLTLVGSQDSWTQNLTHVVPGEWGQTGYTAVLAYDRGTGTAELFELAADQTSAQFTPLHTVDTSGAKAAPQSYTAHYYAAETEGSNVVLQEGLAAAASAWTAAGHEAWTLLSKADGQTAVGKVTQNDKARFAYQDGGLPDVPDAAQAKTQIAAAQAAQPDLIDAIKLGPNLTQSILNGTGAQGIAALVDTLREHDVNSALGLATTANEAIVVVGVIGLPGAGLNLSERRSTGFRWFAVPVSGLRGELVSAGSSASFTPVDEGLSALVLLGYTRRGTLSDPYEIRIDLPDGASLGLLQYEFLMNLLDLAHPAGVGVNTYAIREQHVRLNGSVAALPPTISRTYRPFRRPRGRGQVGQPLEVPPAANLPTWASLGGGVAGPPGIVRSQDGRLQVFARGADGTPRRLAQVAPNDGWKPWEQLDGKITGAIVAGTNADGRLEIFGRGLDGALWHKWENTPNGTWSGWASLGGQVTEPFAIGRNHDGRLELFVKGTDGALYHQWQTAANNGWSGWASLGGQIADLLALATDRDGRLEAFAQGTDGALYHQWQTALNGGWSGWASLGGQIQNVLAVAPNQDGRLEVFACAPDDRLSHIWQTAPNNGWSAWASLGGAVGTALAVAANDDGRLELFAAGTDGVLSHAWQTAPNGGWSAWAPLGSPAAAAAIAVQNADARLELFAWGFDEALWHIWQTAPNNGWNT